MSIQKQLVLNLSGASQTTEKHRISLLSTRGQRIRVGRAKAEMARESMSQPEGGKDIVWIGAVLAKSRNF
jgi:hypothetical protein